VLILQKYENKIRHVSTHAAGILITKEDLDRTVPIYLDDNKKTRYIYETNSFIGDKEKIVSIDDINETINHFKCFDYILENIDTLDEKLIKNLHKMVYLFLL